MKLALAFLTKDRVELSERTIEAVTNCLEPEQNIDLFVVDGSRTPEGVAFAQRMTHRGAKVFTGITGGPDRAILFALDTLLKSSESTYVGLMENDVLLHPDWLGPTLALFRRGGAERLNVGAVSPRAYEDRILLQRDGYAVMHNLGAGMIIFTRQAAKTLIANYRNTYSLENRQTFSALTGLDIGRWWAFRGDSRWLTADWGFDKILAQHGYCSLALTPTLCLDMIGQNPPLEQQGLRLVREPFELLRDDAAFERFAQRHWEVRDAQLDLPRDWIARNQDAGSSLYFPHQCGALRVKFEGAWRLKWTQGFGPFTYVANEPGCTIELEVAGPVDVLVGGGEHGGQAEVLDTVSGYSCAPQLSPEGSSGNVLQLPVPASVSYRPVRLTARTAGVAFYGLQTREPQPTYPAPFSYSQLPQPLE